VRYPTPFLPKVATPALQLEEWTHLRNPFHGRCHAVSLQLQLAAHPLCTLVMRMLIAEIALRQQPPQRVLFGAAQDSAGRQTRGSANHNSPTPGSNTVNGTYGANGAAFTIANYEPRQPHASTMKPVTTPANNPDYFRSQAKRLLAARKSAHGYLQPRGPMMLPGSKYFTRFDRVLC
jgi:hypothetical protein